MSTSGFGERHDLTRSEVLQHRTGKCGCCCVSDNLHERVTISSLLSKLIPVFSSRAEWAKFAESWHSSECWEPDQQLEIFCSVVVLRFVLKTGATSRSARTMTQKAGQSSAQKRSSLASRKCAQLLSEALTAGRPRRSQLLSTRAFHAGSDASNEGPCYVMARRLACCACCSENLNLGGGCAHAQPDHTQRGAMTSTKVVAQNQSAKPGSCGRGTGSGEGRSC